MFRILHISDLHRSPDDPIDNDSLVASLDADFVSQSKENPRIGKIDAIIVSGDIVHGVPLGVGNAQQALRQQYEVACDFLGKLVNRYLDGDRARIVIVPGNHDVDWNRAFSSMSLVSDPRPNGRNDLRGYLNDPQKRYRFSYSERNLYQITDNDLYERRFEMYEDFHAKFYQGVNLAHKLEPGRYWNLFEFDGGKILVAGFNSCEGNDCYRHVGSVPREAVSQAYQETKDSGRPYWLKIAVWHHGIYGSPESSDYMDIERLHQMINLGFSVGIHGHQHKTGVSIERMIGVNDSSFALIGAGSLCAGMSDLPPGELRQYNIIEIKDDYESARIHVREMSSGYSFGPRYRSEFGGNSYKDVKWDREKGLDGLPAVDENAVIDTRLMEAEGMVKAGRLEDGIKVLTAITDLPLYGRRLLLGAYEGLNSWAEVVRYFGRPENAMELISLVKAFLELGRLDEAESAVSLYADRLGIENSLKRDMLGRISVSREMKS